MHATGCFAELYFSPVVGLGPTVDLNLAYLLKGERINTSSTQYFFFFFGHNSKSLLGPVFQLHVEEVF